MTETVYVPTTVYEITTETVTETTTVTERVDVGSVVTETRTQTETETVTEGGQPPDTVTETVTASAGSPITLASPPDPPGEPNDPASNNTAAVALTGLGASAGTLAAAVLVTRIRRPGERRSRRRIPEVRAVGRPDPNPQTTTDGRGGPTVGIDFRARPWDTQVRGDTP